MTARARKHERYRNGRCHKKKSRHAAQQRRTTLIDRPWGDRRELALRIGRQRGGRDRTDGSPPRRHAVAGDRRLDRSPEPRHEQARAALRALLEEDLRRLIPRVHRETERAPMHGKERAAAEQRVRLQRVLRAEMHVAPRGMPGADLQHHEIERPKPLPNGGVFGRESRIPAEEDAVVRRAHHERGPQGGVALAERAAREMLRGRRRDLYPTPWKVERLPPVELRNALRLHAPRFEMCANAERGHEGNIGLRERADGRIVDMVLMVVRDDHNVHGRHLSQCHGHRLEALGSGERQGRCARAPHRVGEDANALDLDEDRRVPEPGRAQSALRFPPPRFERIQSGQRPCRNAPLSSAHELRHRRHRRVGIAQARHDRMQVAKSLARPTRRILDPFEPRALRLGAERFHGRQHNAPTLYAPRQMIQWILRVLASIFVAAAMAGCATAVFNKASNAPWKSGVAADTPFGGDVMRENSIVLAFSGGGLRAAAFTHGTLRALQTVKTPDGDLLDDVAIISSVSGSSLASAYYGIYGRAGLERFREDVLLPGFESGLRLSLLNPANLARMFQGGLNAREDFGDVLDRKVFHGATFGDLYRHPRPSIRIHATDLYHRVPFPFFPPLFAVLCSDISSYPVADAVAASMAVPLVFAPVVVRTYPDNCPPLPPQVETLKVQAEKSHALAAIARAVSTYRAGPVRYIKLADGGLTGT